MKINAAARLRLDQIRIKADWFDDLEPKEQKKYIEDHPNSKHAETHDRQEPVPFYKMGDTEESKDADIDDVKYHINSLIDEIKDIENDGDDASEEREELLKLRTSLSKLMKL